MSNENDQTMKSSELSMLLLGTAAELPTTAAAQNSNPLLFGRKKTTTGNVSASGMGMGMGSGPGGISDYAKDVDAKDVDLSHLDAAQASQLLKRKHAGAGAGLGGTGSGPGGIGRHRRQNIRRTYHDLIDDEMKLYDRDPSDDNDRAENDRNEGGDEDGDEADFQLARRVKKDKEKPKTAIMTRPRVRTKSDSESEEDGSVRERRRRRGRGTTSRGGSSSSSSSDDEESIRRRRRRRRRSSSSSSDGDNISDEDSVQRRAMIRRRRAQTRNRGGHDESRNSNSNNSASSSEEENQADLRRHRARTQKLLRQRQQEDQGCDILEKQQQQEQRVLDRTENERKGEDTKENDSSRSSQEDSDGNNRHARSKQKLTRKIIDVKPTHYGHQDRSPTRRNRRHAHTSSSDSSSDDDSSSSGSSTSSDSSDEDDNDVAITEMAKPLFVPKHQREKQQENELKVQDHERRHGEEQIKTRNEKRIRQSRAMVAQVVASEQKEKDLMQIGGLDEEGDGDEFATNGGSGSTLPPPNDSDDLSPLEREKEKQNWEMRELERLLREMEGYVAQVQEMRELERRRNMTDQERYEEDVKSGRYRKPGEQRQHNTDGSAHMQRYYHRGAFYMDDDTLMKDKDDVRHRASEYARAATGDDVFDKRKMPKVMQAKKFGFAGYSTKYKGLAKEDTTDKGTSYLPVGRGSQARDGRRNERQR